MSSPDIKINVVPKPIIKGKMDAHFPSRVDAEAPILLDKTGGNYSFSLDLNELIESLLSGGVGSSDLPSRAAIAAASIPIIQVYLRTAGYYSPGDGGSALYKSVASEPSHLGKVQSVDGRWWELVERIVTPMMFGAIGSGSALDDDIGAVQGAIDYIRTKGAGYVLIDRFYAISAPVTLRKERIVGSAMYMSGLLKIGSDSTFFVFDNAESDCGEVSNMRLAHLAGPATSGAAFSFTTAGALGAKINRILGEDLYCIAKCDMPPLSVNDIQISECEFLRTIRTGFYMRGALNWVITNNILQMKDGSAGTNCLYIVGSTEGCYFANNYFLGGQYVLRMDATKENKFSQCGFDGGSITTSCIYDTGSKRSHFLSCWISTQGPGGRGIVLDSANIVGFRWAEGEIISTQQNAIQVLRAGSWDVIGGRICNWGVQAAGTFYGIQVAPDAAMRFSVKDVRFAQDADIGGNAWTGVAVFPGSYDWYDISGNSGSGLTGPLIVDNGASTKARVERNEGYNPRGLSAVGVGASPFMYTAGHQPVTLYIRGGTVSDISQAGGGTMYNASNIAMALPANKSVVITYSVVPTIAADIH